MRAVEPRLLYTTRDAAELLSISLRSLEYEIERGALPWVRWGKRGIRIKHEALLQWVADREAETAA